MGAVLFRHNQEAYESALAMLAEKGRAAVIHPTGTGKSFIGFKLCGDFPDRTVCWLSPSAYIFRTQLENWGAACKAGDRTEDKAADGPAGKIEDSAGCSGPDNAVDTMPAGKEDAGIQTNIRFYTYARLMLMREEELAGIQPDYIVLDEFHRCGAKMWGQGVQRLLAQYPDVPVLGLSATNIRYLDGQRDMADELFDGNIASEMTLGDAIVRGILDPPKYVLSMYSCQKELERYRERAKNAKSKAVRAEADQYLEALRRALEKADGLDEVFRKHMAAEEDGCKGHEGSEASGAVGQIGQPAGEPGFAAGQDRAAQPGGTWAVQGQKNRQNIRYGKYLVFCAGYEHMQEMIAKVPEWFAKVDPEPHVYSVYSEDAQAEAEFARFREDRSGHLKLLFCIDMLNEGIHVDGISGVILLRPTISPTIYKQQIGRALSVGKRQGGNAVVFDIVMNIGNLYSIGTVEEEMQAAVGYYRERGEGSLIVNEHFRITDEVGDCMRLFRKLNETLGASWELMYQTAEQYFGAHGNLEVTKRYVTGDGLSLGQWLDTQRRVRAGKVKGILTEAQIARLDRIGMRWQSKADRNWERYFAAAQAYYREHGDLLVNVRDGEYCGVSLGKWLAQLRTYKKSGIRTNYLTTERMEALDSIGMVWDVPDYLWEQNYHAAVQYHRQYGNLDVPYHYVDPDGVKLGVWIANTRFARRTEGTGRAELTDEQIARLDALGMIWENKNNSIWEHAYKAACRYQKKYGNLNIPVAYVTEDGCHLGRWIRKQKNTYQNGMSRERRKKLEAIGID